jgi:Domain of unknown function (DUF4352)
MKISSVLVLFCFAGLLVAGCGGGTTTVTVSGDTSANESEAGEIQERLDSELQEEEAEENGEESDSSSECEEKEINSGSRQEGTCIEGDTKVVVSNLHSPLKLKTLEAKLLGIEERKTIHGEYGESDTANGIFVTFNLKITNLSHAPQELEEEQTVLFVNESIYTQDFEVQNGIEQDSFLWQGAEIQPSSSVEGTVTFDIPKKIAKKITEEGNLDFLNFGAEYYEPEEFYEQEEVGTIRTYM